MDTSKPGLRMILKDYQEVALKYLWERGDAGSRSRDVWIHVNKTLNGERTVSRGSIINFLNTMANEGIMNYTEITGKGGRTRIYVCTYNEMTFKEKFIKTVLDSLMKNYPQATKKVIIKTLEQL
ncbi:MAG: hypothetical protein ABIJ47_15115 [Candidatus Bathyarchaeota archaeon]